MAVDIDFDKYKELRKKAELIAEKIGKIKGNSVIFTFPKPDNLCASGILFELIQNIGQGCHNTFCLNKKDIDEKLKKFQYSNYWFVGFPWNDLPLKKLENIASDVYIINHHHYEDVFELANSTIFSLKEVGLPSNVLSTAGLMYFIAQHLDENYYEFSPLALIGALAENQVEQKTQHLLGLNKIIQDESVQNNIINVLKGTKIPGRDSKPIHLALKYSIDPFLPSLTGKEQACTSFLSKLGITMKDPDDNWRTIASLTAEETRKLNDELISLLMKEGKNTVDETYKLIGPVYIVNSEEQKMRTKNIEEFLQLVEGACHLKSYGLAMAIILGDRENRYDQILRELDQYHGLATEIINQLETDTKLIEDKGFYREVKAEKLAIESPHMIFRTLLKSQTIPLDKPIILVVEENDKVQLYVSESTGQKNKSELYTIFNKYKNKKIIETLSEKADFFEVTVTKDKFKTIATMIEKDLKDDSTKNKD